MDSTWALLREGYPFIRNRCRRLGTDLFSARLMLRTAFCVSGPDAAEMFYEPGRFTRRGAMPLTALLLLQDEGSVATLDGAAHAERKRMFMSLMDRERISALVEQFDTEWRARLLHWEHQGSIVVHEEVQEVLCRAVCAWAGVPLGEAEASTRAREFGAMIDGSGAIGPRNLRGQWLRRRTEQWIASIIERVRARRLNVPVASPLNVVARFRDRDGRLLDTEVATIELLNLLRPTVAVARFITFTALALHEQPDARARIDADSDDSVEAFVQEVRRFYPFFPFVGGIARNAFDWHGHRFAPGSWFLLDLYGTDRDPRTWDDPETFRPERFQHWEENPYNFIPQGGGDHYLNHRCAGEWITISLMKCALCLLLDSMHYEVPRQDLRVSLSRMPAIPASRFRIRKVRRSRADPARAAALARQVP